MLYEQCPQEYKARYIDGVASKPSLAMLFGHSVHTALEALHQGQGGACLDTASLIEDARSRYVEEFDAARRSLAVEGITASGELYVQGLHMIDQVAAMRLQDGHCRAERWMSIPTEWGGRDWPVVGAIDLWCPPWSRHGAVVWDFKTTVGGWSEARAARERWQPLLYSWAYVRAYDQLPTFRYLVLNRATGTVEAFDRKWASKKAWLDDFHDLEFVAEEIADAIADGDFDCTKRHGNCLECGRPFGHEHVCATPKRHRITLSGSGATVRAGI